MIVIGASLGGMKAITSVLRGLPSTFEVPLAVVLHRFKDTDSILIEMLQHESPLPVEEPLDKEPILPGRVYVAPADYHLLVEPGHFSLSVDDPVRYARPSIDVLFDSVADACGPEVIGIVLTGANGDGAAGATRIKARGGRLIVQDPETAEAPQMPRAALAAMEPDYVLAPEKMGPLLVELTTRSHTL